MRESGCPHPCPRHSPSTSSSLPSPNRYSPEVQVLQFLKAADLCGQLLNLVIKKVKHFQILQLCYVCRHSYGDKNADCELRTFTPHRNASNKLHFSSCERRIIQYDHLIHVYLHFVYLKLLDCNSPLSRKGNVSSKGKENICATNILYYEAYKLLIVTQCLICALFLPFGFLAAS